MAIFLVCEGGESSVRKFVLDQQCREEVRGKREREREHGGVYKSGKKAISVAICVLVGLGGDWEQCEWSGV